MAREVLIESSVSLNASQHEKRFSMVREMLIRHGAWTSRNLPSSLMRSVGLSMDPTVAPSADCVHFLPLDFQLNYLFKSSST